MLYSIMWQLMYSVLILSKVSNLNPKQQSAESTGPKTLSSCGSKHVVYSKTHTLLFALPVQIWFNQTTVHF